MKRRITIARRPFLTNVAVLLSKLAHLLSINHELHTARFARFYQLTPLFCSITNDQEPLLLGQTLHHQPLAVRKTKERPELGNMLVVARTGGGKGLLAIPQLLTWKQSVIVNDIKGELRKATSAHRQTFSNVFVLDPRGRGHRFDPLAGTLNESELLAVAEDLLHSPHETDGAIFSMRARDMLTILFLAAQEEGHPKFLYVREALLAGVSATAERLQTVNPRLATRFLNDPIAQARRSRFEDKFLLHAFGTLKAKLTPILTETVVKTLSGSDFSAQDIIAAKRPVTVYLQWPEEQLTALAPLVRLIMGTLLKGMIRTHDDQDGLGCRPVLVLADEAGRTAIPTLADDATTVRSRNITLWIAVQGLSQLETVYGKTRAQTLLDNMDTIIFYRPTWADDATAQALERKLGTKSGFAHSRHEREGGNSSEGQSEQAVPLMEAFKIRQMADEDIIIFHRNLAPIKALRMDWRDFPALVSLRAMPPTAVKSIADPSRLPVFSADATHPDNTKDERQAFEPVSYTEFSRAPGGTIWINNTKNPLNE